MFKTGDKIVCRYRSLTNTERKFSLDPYGDMKHLVSKEGKVFTVSNVVRGNLCIEGVGCFSFSPDDFTKYVKPNVIGGKLL